MATRNDAGSNSFRHPRRHYVVTNLSFNANEIARANAELRRMAGVDPERIRMRDLIKPLRIRTAGMDLYCEPEC
jgi:hypothetical protein